MTTRRKWLIGILALALAAIGGLVARSRFRAVPVPPAVSVPAIPESVVDADVRAALTAAEAKVLAEPRSGAAWGELGMLHRAHGLNTQSNDCFAEAAKLDARNPRWPYLIGLINLLIAPAEAVPHLRMAYGLASDPEYKSAARLRLAEALLERGELDEAERLFSGEVRENPRNPRGHFGLGTVAGTRGDHRAAIGYLAGVANSPFAHRRASGLIAAAHAQLGNVEEAERFGSEAGRGPPDLPWRDPYIAEYTRLEAGRSARLRVAEDYEARGQIPQAVMTLEELARSSPDDQLLVSLGINLAKMGEFARAERTLLAVLARAPDHAVGRYFLGISLYMQAEAATKAGEKARAEPQFRDALKQLRRAAELKPDNGLAHLYAGYSSKHLGDLPAAADECRAAVAASPHLVDTHLGLAEILIAQDRNAEAVPHLERAIRLATPNDTRAKSLLEKIAVVKTPGDK